ncbi:MAG TPA: hypothetical protein PLJ35_05190 [Anaerolineae bacterium]|nr:hypothetical protein [Anaerolineae bacterium]
MMIETMFDVVDRASRDVIATSDELSHAQDDLEAYVFRYNRNAHIRRTTRATDCKEFYQFMEMLREGRRNRDAAYAQHLRDVEEMSAQRWAS